MSLVALGGYVNLAPAAASCCQNTIPGMRRTIVNVGQCQRSRHRELGEDSKWTLGSHSLWRIEDESLWKRSLSRCPDQLNVPERVRFQTMVCTWVGKIILPGESPSIIIQHFLPPAFSEHPPPNSQQQETWSGFHWNKRSYQCNWG